MGRSRRFHDVRGAQAHLRLTFESVQQAFGDARLADARLTREQHDPARAEPGLIPTAEQQVDLLLPADQWRQRALAPRLEAADSGRLAQHLPGFHRLRQPLRLIGIERAAIEHPPDQTARAGRDHDLARRCLTSIEAAMPELPDLNSAEFAAIKNRFARAYLDHKADIGAPHATDQDILDHVGPRPHAFGVAAISSGWNFSELEESGASGGQQPRYLRWRPTVAAWRGAAAASFRLLGCQRLRRPSPDISQR